MPARRVIVYIDGYNFYYGINSVWRKYLWLDLHRFSKSLLLKGQQLIAVKYFTTRIRNNPGKSKRQSAFLDANASIGLVEFFEGYFDKQYVTCSQCNERVDCRKCGKRFRKYTEKQTDVNLTTEIIADAFLNKMDVAILVGGDADYVHPIKTLQRSPLHKHVHLLFPPKRAPKVLIKIASSYGFLFERNIRDNQLPTSITLPNGSIITKPTEWS